MKKKKKAYKIELHGCHIITCKGCGNSYLNRLVDGAIRNTTCCEECNKLFTRFEIDNSPLWFAFDCDACGKEVIVNLPYWLCDEHHVEVATGFVVVCPFCGEEYDV